MLYLFYPVYYSITKKNRQGLPYDFFAFSLFFQLYIRLILTFFSLFRQKRQLFEKNRECENERVIEKARPNLALNKKPRNKIRSVTNALGIQKEKRGVGYSNRTKRKGRQTKQCD